MTRLIPTLAGLAILPVFMACGGKFLGNGEVGDREASLESGLTALEGVIDDLDSGASYGAASSSCVRPVLSTCAGTTQTYDYNGCSGTAQGSLSYQGWTTLSYTGSNCALDIGETVTRTYDVGISGPRGGTMTLRSGFADNYLGGRIGGGGTLVRTGAASWAAEIEGKHKTFKYGGTTIFQTSVRTTSAVTVTGSLDRALRVVTGGTVVVYNNTAEFTTALRPSNLRYSAACCHPVSGSIEATYSGTVEGLAFVEFDGCGQGTIDQGGEQTRFTLSYCE